MTFSSHTSSPSPSILESSSSVTLSTRSSTSTPRNRRKQVKLVNPARPYDFSNHAASNVSPSSAERSGSSFNWHKRGARGNIAEQDTLAESGLIANHSHPFDNFSLAPLSPSTSHSSSNSLQLDLVPEEGTDDMLSCFPSRRSPPKVGKASIVVELGSPFNRNSYSYASPRSAPTPQMRRWSTASSFVSGSDPLPESKYRGFIDLTDEGRAAWVEPTPANAQPQVLLQPQVQLRPQVLLQPPAPIPTKDTVLHIGKDKGKGKEAQVMLQPPAPIPTKDTVLNVTKGKGKGKERVLEPNNPLLGDRYRPKRPSPLGMNKSTLSNEEKHDNSVPHTPFRLVGGTSQAAASNQEVHEQMEAPSSSTPQAAASAKQVHEEMEASFPTPQVGLNKSTLGNEEKHDNSVPHTPFRLVGGTSQAAASNQEVHDEERSAPRSATLNKEVHWNETNEHRVVRRLLQNEAPFAPHEEKEVHSPEAAASNKKVHWKETTEHRVVRRLPQYESPLAPHEEMEESGEMGEGQLLAPDSYGSTARLEERAEANPSPEAEEAAFLQGPSSVPYEELETSMTEEEKLAVTNKNKNIVVTQPFDDDWSDYDSFLDEPHENCRDSFLEDDLENYMDSFLEDTQVNCRDSFIEDYNNPREMVDAKAAAPRGGCEPLNIRKRNPSPKSPDSSLVGQRDTCPVSATASGARVVDTPDATSVVEALTIYTGTLEKEIETLKCVHQAREASFREALKAEIEAEVRIEMKAKLAAEVRREVKAELEIEIRREMEDEAHRKTQEKLSGISAELEHERQDHLATKEDLRETTYDLEVAEKNLDLYKTQARERREAVDRERALYWQLKEETDNLKEEVEDLNEDLDVANENLAAQQAKVEDLTNRLETEQAKVKDLNDQLETKSTELTEEKNKNSDISAELVATQLVKTNIEVGLENAKMKIADLEGEAASSPKVAKSYDHRDEKIVRLQKEVSRLKVDQGRMNAALSLKQQEAVHLRTQLDRERAKTGTVPLHRQLKALEDKKKREGSSFGALEEKDKNEGSSYGGADSSPTKENSSPAPASPRSRLSWSALSNLVGY